MGKSKAGGEVRPKSNKSTHLTIYNDVCSEFIKRHYMQRRLAWFIACAFITLAVWVIVFHYRSFDIPNFVLALSLSVIVMSLPLVFEIIVIGLDNNKGIELCIKILEERNLNLKSLEIVRDRAAVDSQSGRTFLIVVTLIFTLAAPFPIAESFTASSAASVESTSASEADSANIVNEQVDDDPSLNSFLASFSLLIALALFLLALHLERVNIAVIIQHACIEHKAKRNDR